MAVVNNEVSVQMNAGDGETSYTNNSAPQKIGISKALHVLDEALKDMAINDKNGFSKCFKIADLGCSSGPNTLSVVSHIIDKIQQLSNKDQICPDEFQVFLNDLPGNDFNNLFKLLPQFYHKLDHHDHDQGTRSCFVSGVPGSFYGRLFPTNTLDLVYSSFSLQWLSKVPQGLEGNKQNIHMSITSPPQVFQAYTNQYRKDFSTFLSSRALEMAPGGRMALTFVGRSVHDPSSNDDCRHFAILATVLLDMVTQGMIEEADLHSFNMPIYTASKQEVEEMVRVEGSFNLDILEEFLIPWDAHVERGSANVDKHTRGKLVSSFIRAYTEPLLATHFGSSIMDEVYERYGEKLGDHLSREDPLFFNMAICLSKR